VATIADLSNRLRSELGDIGKTFVETFLGDGSTKRFNLSHYPVNGVDLQVISGTTDVYAVDPAQLTVKSGSTDISSTSTIEEHTGVLTLATAPTTNTVITVAGRYYRYFTDSEIQNYLNIAFTQHAGTETSPYGSRVSLANLPVVEEYPVILLAATMALFTLATDSAYDIDITAPDGVHIPRAQRYGQLMELIQVRKEQYRELCTLLNVGLHRIEVATLHKISTRTNRYVPVYKPQELEDASRPQRLRVPVPNYMDQTPETVATYDIHLYRGDSYQLDLDFPFSLSGYTLLSQIRAYSGALLVLATFVITVTDSANGKATLQLTSDQTKNLPTRAIWDIQITSNTDPNYQLTHLKGVVITEDQVTNVNNDPYAPGWQG